MTDKQTDKQLLIDPRTLKEVTSEGFGGFYGPPTKLRKLTAAELLTKLMTLFYEDEEGLIWGNIEGTSIRSQLGEEIEAQLRKYKEAE